MIIVPLSHATRKPRLSRIRTGVASVPNSSALVVESVPGSIPLELLAGVGEQSIIDEVRRANNYKLTETTRHFTLRLRCE